MNNKILGFVAVGLMAGSIAANAQVTTLDYQGSVLVGTSTYLPTGYVAPLNTPYPNLPASPFIGQMSASITLDGSVKANDLTLASYSFGVSGFNYVEGTGTTMGAELTTGPAPYNNLGSQTDFCDFQGDCIDITTSKHGRITGAVVNISASNYNGSEDVFSIGPHGDSVEYLWGHNGTCQNQLPFGPPGSAYTGPTINPCTLSGGSSKHGTWTVSTVSAPEIAPASAASSLTLLFGGLAVLRGRRRGADLIGSI